MQLFELLETKFVLQSTQLYGSEETKILFSTQLEQTPVYLVQFLQLTPHERQVLMVLFKYFPAGQTFSAVHVFF